MAISNQRTPIRNASFGRGFASMDPERQREIPGCTIRTTPSRPLVRAPRPSGPERMHGQPESELAMFEGSSSRRGR